MFSWNDVDVLVAFNFDLDFRLTFSQGQKILFSTLCHCLVPLHMNSAYLLEPLELNLVGVFSWNDVDVFCTFNQFSP